MEALRSGKELEKVFLKKGLRNEFIPGLINEMREKRIPFQFVPVEKINRMCRKNHQGILALVAEIEYNDIEKIIPGLFEAGKLPLIMILDRITDVRNMGAIARTAEGAGIHALVIPAGESARINADAVKTSSGALHSLPVCRTDNLSKTIIFLKESGLQIVSATEKAGKYLYSADFTRPSAVIMGAEDTGIEKTLLKLSDIHVKIPLYGAVNSLNVSVAASIIMYEAVRQRLFSQVE
ncbi:MAG: 23S rRNA (guanosine(2251)-2'-O)-methyltransferase RlmB [Bacteroidales bacterium]|nr:23S rRNA (guanosine(2251)-2'-O)-methyltransferase RlmB [Bacteroidales bacterium]MBN2761878.1 23S rRNA (guanosine(2251)-2'-O)-methyltransferase RlmB [Bacteroidales bacterium]